MRTPNDTRTLTDTLRAMAADDAELGSSTLVEERLRAEVRALGRATRRGRMTFAARAAGLTLVLAVPLGLTLRQPLDTDRQPAGAARTEPPFLATPYAGSFTGEGQIVRVEVPAATLRAFGVTSPAVREQRENMRVLADVLIGEDGVARAIRFVGPVGEGPQ
jgi:hypothetical protein